MELGGTAAGLSIVGAEGADGEGLVSACEVSCEDWEGDVGRGEGERRGEGGGKYVHFGSSK